MAKTKNEELQTDNATVGISPEELARIKAELMAELRLQMKSEAGTVTDTKSHFIPDPSLEEYVERELFKDGRRYKDDVYIGVNDGNCVVQRGRKVKMKRKYALILDQSLKQDVASAEYSESKQREFVDATETLNRI